ncbi:hypothetical protein AJ79_07702 [Helicocarpus griseus UAMH5409]|uniref:Alpha-ketoglutarate-dependent sulfonate dioxygenase n=1 Tax=Helicocarpus griseus UAMH5409 TaxID=1447875 RepID=A0A2B7WZB9_9EURO|nr:hypothetical protein AJ79_07702 [Helicocarpus griseus UAMH5409]
MSTSKSNPNGLPSPSLRPLSSKDPPPTYTLDDPNATSGAPLPSLRELRFDPTGPQVNYVNPTTATPVTVDQCIAHLKLLAAVADLRDTISATDGLFNLYDKDSQIYPTEEERLKAAQLIREKRWAVYVGRAVDRFTVWHEKCVPNGGFGSNQGGITIYDIESSGVLERSMTWENTIIWTADIMPPLDVLMVWHAYMLNPRDFLEDCIRMGKMSFWVTGLPWEVLNFCINNQTFDYQPPAEAAKYFRMQTGLEWENTHDSPCKSLACPRCQGQVMISWQEENPQIGLLDHPFEDCSCYGDKNLRSACNHCGITITHEKLRLAKFHYDVTRLMMNGVPMPGTILNRDGVPENPKMGHHRPSFPSHLIQLVIGHPLLSLIDINHNEFASMTMVRNFIEESLNDSKQVSRARKGSPSILTKEERTAIRKMMSRYWENSSPFALDLVGAVIRQGTFIKKMDDIDWIHSPALDSTMKRLIRKYTYFFRIICENPTKMAVPTLDVDLAWHTHQLSPYSYYTYSTYQTKGKFIDHDDKVTEYKLSSAFQWTSKQYQRLTGGQVYSECTCWYCEAIRETHNSGLFKSSTTAQAQKAADELHSREDIASYPAKGPHISAHSAVRPRDSLSPRVAEMEVKRLQSQYVKAVRRIQKRGLKLGKGGGDEKRRSISSLGSSSSTSKGNSNPYTATPVVWGAALMFPCYAPFAVDPSISAGMYPCNPACMSVGPGAAGNCVGATCSAEAAAGGCGWADGSGGACTGGGGCGGGGGGGGGGGCGGGGGGGGGGC